jgi:uncharacterized protein
MFEHAILITGGLLMAATSAAYSEDVFFPAAADRVETGGEIGRRIEVTIDNNLMVLDADGDFLAPFAKKEGTGGYVGLGKLIDALVRFAAYTGREDVGARKRHVIDTLLATQGEDGYIGWFVPEKRMWALWDIHEMAYIIHGLAMDHRFFGEERSLAAARRAADYIIRRWKAEPDRSTDPSITEYMAITGLETAILAVYEETGDQRYLDFAASFRGLKDWDGPIVTGRWGKIQGHVYAYLGRSISQLRLYRIQPDDGLLRTAHKAVDFMREKNGLAVTGTCGQHECWHDTQEGIANLGETCATAYMIRFFDELVRMEGKAIYGDLMERAIHNALFAAQSPEGRRIRYYVPIEGPREYFKGDTYCCPCNYRRIIAELPRMIAYAASDGAVVNLYTPSKVTLPLPDDTPLTLVQETDYPSDGRVLLKVDPEKKRAFSLRLRIPGWCEGAAVRVNGEKQPGPAAAGEYYVLTRTWAPGDAVELAMPMALRLVRGRKAQAGRAAVMYGPLVFCLNRDRNPDLAQENLRMITLKPETLSGPEPDDSVRPGGLQCRVKAWRTTSWYPLGAPDWDLVLTESTDPGSEMTFFHLPNPDDPALTADPLAAE